MTAASSLSCAAPLSSRSHLPLCARLPARTRKVEINPIHEHYVLTGTTKGDAVDINESITTGESAGDATVLGDKEVLGTKVEYVVTAQESTVVQRQEQVHSAQDVTYTRRFFLASGCCEMEGAH